MQKLFLMMWSFLPKMREERISGIFAEIIETAIEAGATTVNIPDTTGYTFPSEYGRMIAELVKRVSNIQQGCNKHALS